MNYEQKYKEALERARDMMSYKEVRHEDMEYLFPELKESEDEQIRKRIITLVNAHGQGMYKDEMTVWLEKQGEQKHYWSEEDELMLKDAIEFIETGWSDRGKSHLVYWLKSLKDRYTWKPTESERKSVDKVEPRFKVGDFIVNNYCRGKVVELTNDAYLLDTGQGIPFSCEHNIHLWDITKDAKDGDMLCTYECGKPKVVFILKGTPKPKKPCVLRFYCYYNIMYPYFESDSEKGCLVPNEEDVKPATEEQRDLLFQKMKEAGYEFNEYTKVSKYSHNYESKN